MNQGSVLYVPMLHSSKKRKRFSRKRRVGYSVSKYQVFDTAETHVKCQTPS
jgi:hypothetical protein